MVQCSEQNIVVVLVSTERQFLDNDRLVFLSESLQIKKVRLPGTTDMLFIQGLFSDQGGESSYW